MIVHIVDKGKGGGMVSMCAFLFAHVLMSECSGVFSAHAMPFLCPCVCVSFAHLHTHVPHHFNHKTNTFSALQPVHAKLSMCAFLFAHVYVFPLPICTHIC